MGLFIQSDHSQTSAEQYNCLTHLVLGLQKVVQFPVQVHLNKLECHGKVNFSNSTQIVKLMY